MAGLAPARAIPLAAAALWLPPAISFVAGPLTECSHCVEAYLETYVVIPGAWPGITVGIAFGDSDSWLALAVMAAFTLVLLVSVVWALGRGRVMGALALAAAALFSGLSGWVLGHAMRM